MSSDEATETDRHASRSPSPVSNALGPGTNTATLHTSRPTSSYTTNSAFADSAVDVEATSPVRSPEPLFRLDRDYVEPKVQLSPQQVDQSLSDKMRRLAAVAWTLEQDENMSVTKRSVLHTMLNQLQSQLDAVSMESSPCEAAQGVAVSDDGRGISCEPDPQVAPEEEEDIWIDESDLIDVRHRLAATVDSMRLRYEEHQHLHQLTARKLEAVAQRCLEHEHRAQKLLAEFRELRLEKDNLQAENDELRGRLSNLGNEVSRKEVAVEAMSSAVKGLEGWIDNGSPSRNYTPIPQLKTRRLKVVIRGKGRFRGRYYVDEDGDEAMPYSLTDPAVEQQELHDGVKSWLRGFKDMEEVVRDQDPPRSPIGSRFRSRIRTPEQKEVDDWGDFETPTSVSNT